MAIKKIHVIGGPGSGKSYAAAALSSSLNIPSFDLDNIFWDNNADSYGTKATEEDRSNSLKKILQSDSWIIEGVYYSWLQDSFRDADLIAILNPNIYIRDFRIFKRFVFRKLGLVKAKREKLSDFMALIKWNHSYQKNNLIKITDMLRNMDNKTKFFSKADQLINYVSTI